MATQAFSYLPHKALQRITNVLKIVLHTMLKTFKQNVLNVTTLQHTTVILLSFVYCYDFYLD